MGGLIIVAFPYFWMLDLRLHYSWGIYGGLCLFAFFLHSKYIEALDIKGELLLANNQFIIIEEHRKTLIPYSEIQRIVLNPVLGINTGGVTAKAYQLEITWTSEPLVICVSRGGLYEQNGNKFIKIRNLFHPHRDDLIVFLESKHFKLKFGKRV